MPTESPLRLGELRKVENTDVKEHLESKEYLVGWIMLYGKIQPVVFTHKELARPITRAHKNREDMDALAINPPDWQDVTRLEAKVAKLLVEKEALLKRGFLSRLFNVMPKVGDKPGD